jgi:hypothetical protein
MPVNKVRITRSPQGVLSDHPVYMRLMPNERSALEQLASRQLRSMSSVARLIFLAGVGPYQSGLSEVRNTPHRRIEHEE